MIVAKEQGCFYARHLFRDATLQHPLAGYAVSVRISLAMNTRKRKIMGFGRLLLNDRFSFGCVDTAQKQRDCTISRTVL